MADKVKTVPKFDEQKVEREISWLGARLREPSTYAGLGVLLGLLHFADVSSWTAALTSIGVGIGGVIAIVLPEGKVAAAAKVAALALVLGGALAGVSPARADAKVPLPKPRPLFDSMQTPALKSTKPTVAQAQQNPLVVLQQFTVADLQAALADAQAQTPPDATAATCYTALIPFVQSQTQNPLPQGAGIFQALQKARDAKAYLANIQSPTGPLAGLNQACAPLVLDVQNTLLTLGVSVGVIANPAGAAATLTGLPGAVAAFLALPKL